MKRRSPAHVPPTPVKKIWLIGYPSDDAIAIASQALASGAVVHAFVCAADGGEFYVMKNGSRFIVRDHFILGTFDAVWQALVIGFVFQTAHLYGSPFDAINRLVEEWSVPGATDQ